LQKIIITWSVVEQTNFVKLGKEKYQSDHLNFYFTIEDAIKQKKSNVLLLSSVLAYLKEPEAFLETILSYHFQYIILYRTAFVKRDSHLLTLQIAPPSIYNASYPSWFFNEERIVTILSKKYSLETSFNGDIETNLLVDKNECYWKGLVFKLKK
jgi:putative methyltransferase (TIGR04325 family)